MERNEKIPKKSSIGQADAVTMIRSEFTKHHELGYGKTVTVNPIYEDNYQKFLNETSNEDQSSQPADQRTTGAKPKPKYPKKTASPGGGREGEKKILTQKEIEFPEKH